jgi:hypothetical protein
MLTTSQLELLKEMTEHGLHHKYLMDVEDWNDIKALCEAGLVSLDHTEFFLNDKASRI